jgi:predicted site-specific integrase-resolvase
MQMLRVSRRTMDNYIKAGKLTPTRIRKRNYFEVSQVKALMKIPDERLLSYGVDVPWLREMVRPMLEMGDDY